MMLLLAAFGFECRYGKKTKTLCSAAALKSSQSASLQKLRFRLAAMHLQHRFLRLERNRGRRRSGGRKDFLENRCCELEAIAQR